MTLSGKLPDCMMPDGAEPCSAYTELYEEVRRLREGMRDPAQAARIRREDVAACLSQLKLETFPTDADDPDDQMLGVSIVGHSRAVDKIMALITLAAQPPAAPVETDCDTVKHMWAQVEKARADGTFSSPLSRSSAGTAELGTRYSTISDNGVVVGVEDGK